MGSENPPIKRFRDLVAWKKAYSLGLATYKLTWNFPDHERFALASQLRRGAVSVASNIAEGYGRGGRSDYLRFLKIARGALYELDTQLSFAQDLGYTTPEEYSGVKGQLDEAERVLAGLIRAIEDRA